MYTGLQLQFYVPKRLQRNRDFYPIWCLVSVEIDVRSVIIEDDSHLGDQMLMDQRKSTGKI